MSSGYVGTGGRRFQSSVLASGIGATYTSRTALPFLTPRSGESASALHARRKRAATTRSPRRAPAPATRKSVTRKPAPRGPNVSPEARTALQTAMARYEPGGGYGKGVEAGLARGRTQAMSGGMQNLVSSGLAGTTIAGGLGKKYEQEVAAPARAQVEEGRATALSSLQVMLAQMEQGGHQATLGREFQASESALGREFQGNQSALGRQFAASESGFGRQFQGSQSAFGRQFATSESALSRQFQGNQSALGRQFAASESSLNREFQASESALKRTIPGGYAPQYTSTIPSSLAPPPESRIPGSYVGSINGKRWVYNEQGIPTRAQ